MSYAATILAESSLQSYWKLDEASGNISDSKGALGGTAAGTLSYAQSGANGNLGNAIKGNGSTGRFYLGDNLRFSGTSNYTIECWAKRPATGNRIVCKYDENTGNGWLFAFDSSTGKIYAARHNGTTLTDILGSTVISSGAWAHIACTYDGSTLRLYVNGVLDASVASSISIGSPTTKVLSLFSSSGGGNYCDATMQHVAIYNTALSASSLLAHYQAASNTYTGTAGDTWAWSDSPALTGSGGTVISRTRYPADTWAWSDSTARPTRTGGTRRAVFTAGTVGTVGAHYAFGSVVRTNDRGGLLAVARKATTHGTWDGSLVGKLSTDDGATWGSEFTIVNNATTGYDERDPKMVRLASGRIVMTWGRRKQSGAYSIGTQPQFIYSDDGGSTWSSPVTITTNLFVSTGGVDGLVYGSDIVELANGDLLAFGYGFHASGSTALDLFCSKSTDGGATWSHLSNPALYTTFSYNAVEPQVVRLDDGTLYLIFHIENGVPSTVKVAKSTDNGSTWTISNWVITAENRQGLATTLSGVGAAVSYLVTGDGTYYRESLDRGRSYGSAVLIDTYSDLSTATGFSVGSGLWSMPVTLAGSGLSQNVGFIYGAEVGGGSQNRASIFYKQFSGLDGAFIYPRGATDTWAWSDSASRQFTRTRTAGDTWAWSDSVTRSRPLARASADTWAWTDTATQVHGSGSTHSRTAADTWSWSDTVTGTLRSPTTVSRTTADTWAWTDHSNRSAPAAYQIALPATADFISARSQTADFISARSQTADFTAGPA